jgi:hypothetical protein
MLPAIIKLLWILRVAYHTNGLLDWQTMSGEKNEYISIQNK